MAFWIATADATGALITSSELVLNPGPSTIDYPFEALGTYVETEGTQIFQQPTLDNRKRSWIWEGYPANQAGFKNVWPVLEGLRSSVRVAMGLSPYAYLMEDVTTLFRQRVTLTGTGSGSGFTFTTTGLPANALVGGFINCAGQVRPVLSNTTTVMNLGFGWNGSVSGAYSVQYNTFNFYRVRVLEAVRRVDDKVSVTRFADARITFVVDDPASTSLVG